MDLRSMKFRVMRAGSSSVQTIKNIASSSYNFSRKTKIATFNLVKKTAKDWIDDINGTNIFDKYVLEPSTIKTHSLFSGGGYQNFFKQNLFWFGLLCPVFLFTFTPLYLLMLSEAVYSSWKSFKPAKLKDNVEPSHRQKRMKQKKEDKKKKMAVTPSHYTKFRSKLAGLRKAKTHSLATFTPTSSGATFSASLI